MQDNVGFAKLQQRSPTRRIVGSHFNSGAYASRNHAARSNVRNMSYDYYYLYEIKAHHYKNYGVIGIMDIQVKWI